MSKSADSSGKNAPSSTWRDRIFRPGWMVILALVIAVPVLGPWALRQVPDLQTRPEYRIPFSHLQLEPPPPDFAPRNLLEQVQLRANLDPELSVLDTELPRRLAEAFAGHPWIEQVIAVRNTWPASVTIELKYRRPVALIQVNDGFYAVDAKGVLLPPSDFNQESLQQYLPVAGIASRPRGAAGQVWSDPAVLGAAKLADFLGARWKPLGLAGIEIPAGVGSKPDDLRFELKTAGGSRILWGRIPGSTHPGELAARQKLGRLEKYIAEFGSFDEPHGPYEIDIRHWQEISRRQLAHPHANTARGNSHSSPR